MQRGGHDAVRRPRWRGDLILGAAVFPGSPILVEIVIFVDVVILLVGAEPGIGIDGVVLVVPRGAGLQSLLWRVPV